MKQWLTPVLCGRTGRRIGMYRVTAILNAVRRYSPRTGCVFRVHSKSRTVRDTNYVERRPGGPCLLPLPLSHPGEDLPRGTGKVLNCCWSRRVYDWAGSIDVIRQTWDSTGLGIIRVMRAPWCWPQVICLRSHAWIVKIAVDEPFGG